MHSDDFPIYILEYMYGIFFYSICLHVAICSQCCFCTVRSGNASLAFANHSWSDRQCTFIVEWALHHLLFQMFLNSAMRISSPTNYFRMLGQKHCRDYNHYLLLLTQDMQPFHSANMSHYCHSNFFENVHDATEQSCDDLLHSLDTKWVALVFLNMCRLDYMIFVACSFVLSFRIHVYQTICYWLRVSGYLYFGEKHSWYFQEFTFLKQID